LSRGRLTPETTTIPPTLTLVGNTFSRSWVRCGQGRHCRPRGDGPGAGTPNPVAGPTPPLAAANDSLPCGLQGPCHANPCRSGSAPFPWGTAPSPWESQGPCVAAAPCHVDVAPLPLGSHGPFHAALDSVETGPSPWGSEIPCDAGPCRMGTVPLAYPGGHCPFLQDNGSFPCARQDYGPFSCRGCQASAGPSCCRVYAAARVSASAHPILMRNSPSCAHRNNLLNTTSPILQCSSGPV
jgi:hypothetical protein